MKPTWQRALENYFQGILLTLFIVNRYPFADQISKSQLYAVGSMHSWPSLLAMLTWMVEQLMVSLTS